MPLLLTRRSFSAVALGAAAAPVFRLRGASKSAHWALLSDIHIPADPSDEYRGFRPHDNLKKTVPAVVSAKPEGVLICGDLARLLGQPADYAQAKTLLEPLTSNAPLGLLLGNHDNRKSFLEAFGPAQQGVQKVQGRHVVVIESGPVRLVLLDSLLETNVTPGLLGKAQRTWLQTFLAKADSRPTLIFVHHTLDDNDGSLTDVDRLFAIVRGHRQVKAIVYGHSHRYAFDKLDDGLHLINLPAVGYNFNDGEPVGWVDSRLSAEGGEFTLHAFAGNRERDGKTVSVSWRNSRP